MVILSRSGPALLGLLTLWPLVSCIATAASAPAAVDRPAVAASGAPGPAVAGLRIALTEPFGGNVALWVAEATGLFRKHQLVASVERRSDAAAYAALAKGDLDVVVGSGAPAVAAAAGGTEVRLVAGLVNQYPHRLMVASDIELAKDLRGTRLAVSRSGSASDLAARQALRDLRLEPGADVTLLQIGSAAERLAALENGAIQGAALTPPDTAHLERLGFHTLVDLSHEDAQAPVNQVIVAARLVRERPGEIEKLVRALVEGTALAKRDRDLATRVLSQHLNTTDSVALDETYELFVLRLALRAPYPVAVRDLVREAAETNARAATLDPAVLVDRGFVQQIVDSGYLTQLYPDEKAAGARR